MCFNSGGIVREWMFRIERAGILRESGCFDRIKGDSSKRMDASNFERNKSRLTG